MKQVMVPRFVSEDGTEFNTREECLIHEAKLNAAGLVSAYIEKVKEGGGKLEARWETRTRNLLMDFETWRHAKESSERAAVAPPVEVAA